MVTYAVLGSYFYLMSRREKRRKEDRRLYLESLFGEARSGNDE